MIAICTASATVTSYSNSLLNGNRSILVSIISERLIVNLRDGCHNTCRVRNITRLNFLQSNLSSISTNENYSKSSCCLITDSSHLTIKQNMMILKASNRQLSKLIRRSLEGLTKSALILMGKRSRESDFTVQTDKSKMQESISYIRSGIKQMCSIGSCIP